MFFLVSIFHQGLLGKFSEGEQGTVIEALVPWHLRCICFAVATCFHMFSTDFEYAKSAKYCAQLPAMIRAACLARMILRHVWPGGSWLRRHVHVRFDGTSLKRKDQTGRVHGVHWTGQQFHSGSILEARSHWRRGANVFSRLTANMLASNWTQFGNCYRKVRRYVIWCDMWMILNDYFSNDFCNIGCWVCQAAKLWGHWHHQEMHQGAGDVSSPKGVSP